MSGRVDARAATWESADSRWVPNPDANAPSGAGAGAGGGGDRATLFGSTVYRNDGESLRSAYERVSRAYGGSLDAIRLFFPGLPGPWSRISTDLDRTPVVVSFRADPGAIISGAHDARLREWFATAPTDRRTYWTYWHEPENDTVDLAQYRAAWRHLSNLADSAGNPQLRSTLILMCWTLNRLSGRDWKVYYAGSDVIDVLAFDCYNKGRMRGVYADPAGMLKNVVATAASVGKPWGIAEFGSLIVDTDGGTAGRAEWLRAFANEVRTRGGVFATYFDSVVGGDFRLTDAPSQEAWRTVVQSY